MVFLVVGPGPLFLPLVYLNFARFEFPFFLRVVLSTFCFFFIMLPGPPFLVSIASSSGMVPCYAGVPYVGPSPTSASAIFPSLRSFIVFTGVYPSLSRWWWSLSVVPAMLFDYDLCLGPEPLLK